MDRWLALPTVLLALTACTAAETPASKAESRSPLSWEAPDDYRFVVDSDCGERDFLGRYVITVEDGRAVTTAGNQSKTEPPSSPAPRDVPTLEELLKEARNAELGGADQVEVEFDEGDGHPVFIEIDYHTDGIDDEACYSITRYEEL